MQCVRQTDTIRRLADSWGEARESWRAEGMADRPLGPCSAATSTREDAIRRMVIALLQTSDPPGLHACAAQVRDDRVGAAIEVRAVVEASNVCGATCTYCPMRRQNLRDRVITPLRLDEDDIVLGMHQAYQDGIRQMFIQSGEDPAIVTPVAAAVRRIRKAYGDAHVILNLGDLPDEAYRELREAGADGYLLKHETADPALHAAVRPHSTIEERVGRMIAARRAGMYVGTGNIVGLPGQRIETVADDVLFAGRFGSDEMVSTAPFTPSPTTPLRDDPAGDFGTTLNLISVLRILFPRARIPSVSNLDNPLLTSRPADLGMRGQSAGILAGANGITVNYTPAAMSGAYAIYDPTERKIIKMADAMLVSQQTSMPLYLRHPHTRQR